MNANDKLAEKLREADLRNAEERLAEADEVRREATRKWLLALLRVDGLSSDRPPVPGERRDVDGEPYSVAVHDGQRWVNVTRTSSIAGAVDELRTLVAAAPDRPAHIEFEGYVL